MSQGPKHIELPYKPIVIMGGVAIGLTTVGVIMACCTKLSMHCICVTLTSFILLALSVILVIVGIVFTVPGYQGANYINENCKLLQSGSKEID